jgi:hypothetical protein
MNSTIRISTPAVRIHVVPDPERLYVHVRTRAPSWTVEDKFLIGPSDRRTAYEIATDKSPEGLRWSVNQCGYLWERLHTPELAQLIRAFYASKRT